MPIGGYIEDANGVLEAIDVGDYVHSSLARPQQTQIAILGDYGAGKSWFCLHLAKRLAEEFRGGGRRLPLPLLVTFKAFESGMDLEKLIRSHLLDAYGVEVDGPLEFRRALSSGRILLLLDGMDEMGKALGERTALVAYSRLGIASEIKKVVISCRTHYFYSGSEQREILGNAYTPLQKFPTFEILHINMLDKARVRECVRRRFDMAKANQVLQFIDSTYNLAELCSRPVLLALVCESHGLLPNLPASSSQTDLYEAYIDAWLHREVGQGRLVLDPGIVKSLFEDLANEMFSRETDRVETKTLQMLVHGLLREANLPPHQWADFERQLLTSSFVKRSVGDRWQFAHRSFQEYFYARKFFSWEARTGGVGTYPIIYTPIWQFIAQLSTRRWNRDKALSWINEKVERHADPTLTRTTLRAAAAYWIIKRAPHLAGDVPLSGIMLDSVDLSNVNLSGIDFSHSDFHTSDLTGSKLTGCDLRASCLVGTRFRATDLQAADLTSCDIAGADFRGANFGQVDSASWSASLTQLRSCPGRRMAIFDQEINRALS